jgi:signal peptidase I
MHRMHIDNDNIFGLPGYAKTIIIIAGIIIGFILTRIFLFVPFLVQDDSMKPNFNKGDYVLILKILSPKVGDAVLIKSPVEQDKAIFKRLIATSGEEVEIKGKRIYINNTEFIPKDINYNDNRIFPKKFSNRDNMDRIKLKREEIFVIGDNFDHSFDSREYGPIPVKNIIGKTIYKF